MNKKFRLSLSIIFLSIIIPTYLYCEQSTELNNELEINKDVFETILLAIPRVSGELAYAYIDYLLELMLIYPEGFFDVAVEHEKQFKHWLEFIQLYFWYTKNDITYEKLVEKTESMIQRLNEFKFQDERENYRKMVIEALKELRVKRRGLDEG